MKELTVEIKNQQGLHTRPVKLIVQTYRKYSSKLEIGKVEKSSNNIDFVKGDDMLGLLSLAVLKGEKLLLRANGEDEEKVLEELYKLIEVEKFGEN